MKYECGNCKKSISKKYIINLLYRNPEKTYKYTPAHSVIHTENRSLCKKCYEPILKKLLKILK